MRSALLDPKARDGNKLNQKCTQKGVCVHQIMHTNKIALMSKIVTVHKSVNTQIIQKDYVEIEMDANLLGTNQH